MNGMERSGRAGVALAKAARRASSGLFVRAMEAFERRWLLAAHVVGDGTVYNTIQDAVDAAPTGGTVTVDPGTYNELVRVNKTGLIVQGAQAGVDGRTPSRGGAGESPCSSARR